VTDADELSEGDEVHIEDQYWTARARVLSVGDPITDPADRSFELEIIASEGYDPEDCVDWTVKPTGKLTWRISTFEEATDGEGFSGWKDVSNEAVVMRVEE